MRGLPLWGRCVTSLGLTACRFKTPYTALRGIPMRLKMAGALIPVLLRAITLQRCRIVVRGILGQYQYYCMFCPVTHIVGSNLKSKNQEVSGFSDQWVLNAMVVFNEILNECLPALLFERTKFSRNLQKVWKFSHLKKSAITFAQGCTLVYHWTDHTGRPLEPQVHWDATGTTLADASTQWCSRGDPVLICTIGTHWNTNGATSTQGCHWNHTGWC